MFFLVFFSIFSSWFAQGNATGKWWCIIKAKDTQETFQRKQKIKNNTRQQQQLSGCLNDNFPMNFHCRHHHRRRHFYFLEFFFFASFCLVFLYFYCASVVACTHSNSNASNTSNSNPVALTGCMATRHFQFNKTWCQQKIFHGIILLVMQIHTYIHTSLLSLSLSKARYFRSMLPQDILLAHKVCFYLRMRNTVTFTFYVFLCSTSPWHWQTGHNGNHNRSANHFQEKQKI